MRRFARVLRRFADRIDPPEVQLTTRNWGSTFYSTLDTPANVTFDWTRRA